jgi:hypothetical protein
METITNTISNASKKKQDILQPYTDIFDFVNDIILVSLEEASSNNYDDEVDGWAEIDTLVDQHRQVERTSIQGQLQKAQYLLIDHTSVVAVMGTNRTEIAIIAVLALVLEYHAGVVADLVKPSTTITEDMVERLTDAIYTILISFHQRLRELRRTWRQQRKDVGIQMQSFANGLFSGLFEELKKSNNAVKLLKRAYASAEEDTQDDVVTVSVLAASTLRWMFVERPL